jgi:hypothetical protein
MEARRIQVRIDVSLPGWGKALVVLAKGGPGDVTDRRNGRAAGQ